MNITILNELSSEVYNLACMGGGEKCSEQLIKDSVLVCSKDYVEVTVDL